MINSCHPSDTWGTGKPDLSAGLRSVISSEYGNIAGIAVVRNGCIVCEEYFHGHTPEKPVHVASVTKSILSALIGIAIEQGYLASVNQRVLHFFPGYTPSRPNEVRGNITLEHLLTMTAPYSYEDWKEPLEQLCTSPDWVQFALDQLGENGEPGVFKYSTAGAHLLSAILSRATGRNAREFANEFLFSRTGMREIPDVPMAGYGYEDLFGKGVTGWVHDPRNITTGGWGLAMTVRDMARFGLLYLNHGLWNGTQVVPEHWVTASTKPNANHYGYLWWLYEEPGIFAFAAMGDGGNTICCVPDRNLVVAVASGFMINPKDRWTLIRDHIIPWADSHTGAWPL